jgi:hypothetical protein
VDASCDNADLSRLSGMSLLTAVEYITPDPGRRIALYRRSSAEFRSISGMGQDDAGFSKIAPLIAKDLAFLERSARPERVSG